MYGFLWIFVEWSNQKSFVNWFVPLCVCTGLALASKQHAVKCGKIKYCDANVNEKVLKFRHAHARTDPASSEYPKEFSGLKNWERPIMVVLVVWSIATSINLLISVSFFSLQLFPNELYLKSLVEPTTENINQQNRNTDNDREREWRK